MSVSSAMLGFVKSAFNRVGQENVPDVVKLPELSEIQDLSYFQTSSN